MTDAQEAHFIVFLTGERPDQRPFWAYLAVPARQYDLYCAARARGDFSLEEYGTVLAYGEGLSPSIAEQNEMAIKYGLDRDFEKKLFYIKSLIDGD